MKGKESLKIAIASVLTIVLLYFTVSHNIDIVETQARKNCFTELNDTSHHLVSDLVGKIRADSALVAAIGDIIKEYPADITNKQLIDVLNSFDLIDYYISYMTVLRPNNTLVHQDGRVLNVNGILDFETEFAKGRHVTDATQGLFNFSEKVVLNTTTISKNGKPEAVLYGVVPLPEFANRFKTPIYRGKAALYIVDGDNGELLLDTWHNSLDNVNSFKDRKTLEGYDYEQFLLNLKNSISGDIAFVSHKTNDNMYLHYEPTGINNWSVMVSVPEKIAFAKAADITSNMNLMSALIAVILLCYTAYVLYVIFAIFRRVHNADMQDANTQLQNRRAYDSFLTKNSNVSFQNIACIFVDANGLHDLNNTKGHLAGDMLLASIANAMKTQFSYDSLYRIGGDEFVAICLNADLALCTEKANVIRQLVIESGYSVSIGVAFLESTTGFIDLVKLADAKMLEDKREYYRTHNRRKEN